MTLFLGLSLPTLAIECPKDAPMGKGEKCYPCEVNDNLFPEGECNKCPEFRKFENGLCTFTKSPYPDRPLMYTQEYTIGCIRRHHSRPCGRRVGTYFSSCNELGAERVTEENCILCPDRKFENGSCVLKECPQKYFRDDEGNCLKCSQNYPYKTTEEECQKCANSEYSDGKCYTKCSEDEFRDERGRCVWCEREGEVKTSEFECNKCPNRLYSDGGCWIGTKPEAYLNSCDLGWIFVNGHCGKCDSSETFKVSESDCLKCNQYEELRVYDSQSGECRPK